MKEFAQKVLDIEIEALKKLYDRIDDSFIAAMNILFATKGRVVITGMGKSGLVGRKISATLASTGTPSFFLHPAEASHGDLGMVGRDDTVIAISNGGETQELINILPVLKRFGVEIIAMTGKPKSTLAQYSDVVLDISVEKEACPLNLAPTASTTVTLVLGDMLAVTLLKMKNFKEEDFAQFHPGGSLGKRFIKVSDLMLIGDAIPFVKTGTKLLDAIPYISAKKKGMAVVVDEKQKLLGIFTDGDARRMIEKKMNVDTLVIDDVMTKMPKTISSDRMAEFALRQIEEFQITSLVVIDADTTVVGIIHIHDLLKAGIV